MPRQFTTRGHRLVFSNGIIGLAVASTILVVAFGADVSRLIPFYAIGVFTSFTLSQAGMAKRHLRLREPRWRLGLVINGIGAFATAIVLLVIAVTKFTHGAWAVMVFVPVMVWLLVRMNHQYEREHAELQADLERADAAERPRARWRSCWSTSSTEDGARDPVREDDPRRGDVALHLERDPIHGASWSAWDSARTARHPAARRSRQTETPAPVAGFVGGWPTTST